jgi:KDO2-lipid IV(A) lauroyltransferase
VARVLDSLVYGAFRAVWAVAAFFPLPVLRGGLEGAARVASVVDRRHRKVIRGNLCIAFPDWPSARVHETMRAAFSCWGRIAAELMHADAIADRYRDDPAYREVETQARALLALGHGLVVLTAHTGNFELMARILGRNTGIRFGVFHRTMSNPFVDAFLVRERQKDGFLSFGRGSAARRALELLADGGALVVPLDQNQKPGRGVFVDFFGKPASTTPLLARLALAAGAPILPVFAVWQHGQIVPVLGEPTMPGPAWQGLRGKAREAQVLEITRRGTADVERVIRRYPKQWNWAHRRWKTQPEQ